MTIERALIVFNADGSVRGIATYDASGVAVEATGDELDALLTGAGMAATIEKLTRERDTLKRERDEALARIPASPEQGQTAAAASATPYAALLDDMTMPERELLAAKLRSTGAANTMLQITHLDAMAGKTVSRADLIEVMTAAGVLTATRAAELA